MATREFIVISCADCGEIIFLDPRTLVEKFKYEGESPGAKMSYSTSNNYAEQVWFT